MPQNSNGCTNCGSCWRHAHRQQPGLQSGSERMDSPPCAARRLYTIRNPITEPAPGAARTANAGTDPKRTTRTASAVANGE